MALTVTKYDSVFHVPADFMTMRGCVGMDAGAVAGKGKPVYRDESVSE